jgi:autotransporter-associated beta strand protein
MKTGLTLIILTATLLGSPVAHAVITVSNHWRMGENDPGAANGLALFSTADTVGGNTLYLPGAPFWRGNVSSVAANNVGSFLGVDFFGPGLYGSISNVISSAVDNFGLEFWVKPADTNGNKCLAYNGAPGTNGWGIYQNGASYQGLLGATYFGAGVVATGTWTHVALVRNNGLTTLYVDGVAAGSATSTVSVPAGRFGVAARPTNPTQDQFIGVMDEMRFFTFSPGQFNASDLLVNSVSPIVSNLKDSGPGSLRQAMLSTNYFGAPILISAAFVSGTIALASPLPLITNNVTLNGPGMANLTISGSGANRILFVDAPGTTVNINNLTLANGLAKGGKGGSGFGGGGGLGAGGALFVNAGSVTVSSVGFSNNAAIGGSGGDSAGAHGGGGGGFGGGGGNSVLGGGCGGGGFGGRGGDVATPPPGVGAAGAGGGGLVGAGGAGGPGAGSGGGGLGDGQAPSNGTGGTGGMGGGGNGGNYNLSGSTFNGQAGQANGGGGGGGTGNVLPGYPGGYGGAGGKFGGGGGGTDIGSAGAGGDFGGGGGGAPTQNYNPGYGNGAAGGFGGGGGGSATSGYSGPGGFGGGSGATSLTAKLGSPGAFGGTGGSEYINQHGAGGGGGAALGGAIFVRSDNGASLRLMDSIPDNAALTGGSAGSVSYTCGLDSSITCASSGSTAGSAMFLLGGTNTITVSSGSETIGGTIAGWANEPTTLLKDGNGTLVLTAANAYVGETFLYAGTLSVSAIGNLGQQDNEIDFNHANLQIAGGSYFGPHLGPVVLHQQASIEVLDASTVAVFAGTWSGAGSLTMNGPGTLNLVTSPNSYFGGTTLNLGTIEIGHDRSLGTGPLTINGGVISSGNNARTPTNLLVMNGNFTVGNLTTFAGNATLNSNIIITASNPGLPLGDSGFSGAISGAHSLTIAGGVNAENLFFTGTNSYSGGTKLSSGVLGIAGDWSLGNAAAGLTFDGGTLKALGPVTASRPVTITSGGGALNGNGFDTSFATMTSDPLGTLTKTGAGHLILTGTNVYQGTLTIGGGTFHIATNGSFQLGNGGPSGTLYGNVINDGMLTFNRSDNIFYSGIISGNGGLQKTNNDVVALTGRNNFAGVVRVMGGILSVTNGGGIANSTPSGINGGGQVTVSGSGSTWTMAGDIFISNGGGAGSLLVANGGVASDTFALAGRPGGVGSVTVTDPGSKWIHSLGLVIGLQGGTGNMTISNGGQVTNNEGVVASDAGSLGTVLLTGTNSSWTCGNYINIGQSGNGTLTVANAASLFANQGGFGNGTITLAANSGSAGTLNIGAPVGSPAVTAGTIYAAAVLGGSGTGTNLLNFNHNTAGYVFHAMLNGGLTVQHNGSGLTTLIAASTYTGGTTINAGTLRANNSTGSGTGLGTVSVASGATLGGTGSIAGNTTVSGTLSPGGPSLLTFSNNLTLASSAVTLMEIADYTRGAAKGYDAINVGGTLTFGGKLKVVFLNGFTPAAGSSFNLFDWGSASGSFNSFDLPTLASGLAWNTSALYTSGTLSVVSNPPPVLSIVSQGPTVLLAWPTNDPAFSLQYATNLPATIWISNPVLATIVGGRYTTTDTATNSSRFYRLIK